MELKQRTLTNYSVELASGGEDEKPAVVHIKARSNDCVYACPLREYEDFGGMYAPDVVTLNFEHDINRTIGKAYNFTLTEYGLECDAEIYPSLPVENSDGKKVINMLRLGVPLQASITFDWDEQDDVEVVEEGQTAEVNDIKVTGPAVIYRRWNLRSLAICIHGADNSTDVEAINLSKERFEELLMKKRSAEEPVVDEEKKQVNESDEQVEVAPTEETSDVEQRLSAVEASIEELKTAIAALQATTETEPEPVKIEESEEEKANPEDEEKKELSKKIDSLESAIKNLSDTMLKNYNAEKAASVPVGYPVGGEEKHNPLMGSLQYSAQGLANLKK